MKKLLLLITLVSMPIFTIQAAKTPVEIENFDIRYYHPSNYGLKDLVFEIRIKNLLENMNKNLSLGTLADVYFKVYWMMPGRYKIRVEGLPKGFRELKAELRNMIKGRLDFVIPQKLGPRVRSYSLSTSKIDKGTKITGKDVTNTKAINEIQLEFNNKGMLRSYTTSSPMGINQSKIDMSAKSWSHNKWLIDQMVVDTIRGNNKLTVKHEIDYMSKDGFGFPKKVTIATSGRPIKVDKKVKLPKIKPVISELLFSNYEVNTGKAQKEIIKNPGK